MDSGHQSVEDGDIYAELPARIADMELQIKTLKDNNKSEYTDHSREMVLGLQIEKIHFKYFDCSLARKKRLIQKWSKAQ